MTYLVIDVFFSDPSDPSVYKKDIPEDIEDLGISDPGENENKKSQWRHGRKRARKEDMEEVLKIEDEMLQQRGIHVLRVVNDTQDLEETKEEEERASGRAANGVSRIRRDVYQVVVRERELRARGDRPKKKQRVDSSSANSHHVERDNTPKGGQFDASEIGSIDDIELVPSTSSGENIFDNSSLILSSPDLMERDEISDKARRSVRTVSIAVPLTGLLKAHQVEGIRFMWKNCFSDLAFVDASANDSDSVGGCILAHVSLFDQPFPRYFLVAYKLLSFPLNFFLLSSEHGTWQEPNLCFIAACSSESPKLGIKCFKRTTPRSRFCSHEEFAPDPNCSPYCSHQRSVPLGGRIRQLDGSVVAVHHGV